jgi:4'-phosphopantetheinyl transferase EntD
MVANANDQLTAAIERLAVPGILVGHRPIVAGDECALLPEETIALSRTKSRRASGAARIVARELLARAGYGIGAILKLPCGAPSWPTEMVGSLAHDSDIAVAAIAPRRSYANIGIDVEPAEALPFELLNLIATPSERSVLASYRFGGRLLFAAKEAVYKAVGTLDQVFLNHQDVEIDFLRRRALVRNGRTVEFRFCISTHLLVLAFVRHAPRDACSAKSCAVGI